MESLASYLSDHRFSTLFIEALGWESASASATIQIAKRGLDFRVVAHLRGVMVVTCRAHRRVLANRQLLRQFQFRASEFWREHVLIFFDDQFRQQVWLWAFRGRASRRILHREDPFYSAEPSPVLLERLEVLRFCLEGEGSAAIVDALSRVRHALEADADIDAFFRQPFYSARSHTLALAIPAGGAAAFHEFVTFHIPVADWFAEHWYRRIGIPLEDARQIAYLGLIEAAKLFGPISGNLFSTYAGHRIRKSLKRLGPEFASFMSIPPHLFWEYRRVLRAAAKRFSKLAQAGGDELDIAADIVNSQLAARWTCVRLARSVRSLSDRKSSEFRAAHRLSQTLDNGSQLEYARSIPRLFSHLPEREARVLRLRYGIGGPPLTLEVISHRENLTPERVRQIQVSGLDRLQRLLIKREIESTRRFAVANDTPVRLQRPPTGVPPLAEEESQRLYRQAELFEEPADGGVAGTPVHTPVATW